jgi:hypothetical protein
MHLIRKVLIRRLQKGDVAGQRRLTHTVFGIAAQFKAEPRSA